MENSECCAGEDVSLTPDTTADSSITPFIEIPVVPLRISTKDFPNTVQVKDEFTADIKQEPEDLCEMYGPSVANVSLYVFFLILKIALLFHLIYYRFIVLIISFYVTVLQCICRLMNSTNS